MSVPRRSWKKQGRPQPPKRDHYLALMAQDGPALALRPTITNRAGHALTYPPITRRRPRPATVVPGAGAAALDAETARPFDTASSPKPPG
jgi:hypothetical protein